MQHLQSYDADLNSRFDGIQQQLDARSSVVDSVLRDYAANKQRFEDLLHQDGTRLARLNATVDARGPAMEQLSASVDATQASVRFNETEIRDLKDTLGSATAAIVAINATIQDMRAGQDRIEASQKEQARSLEKSMKSMHALTKLVSDLYVPSSP